MIFSIHYLNWQRHVRHSSSIRGHPQDLSDDEQKIHQHFRDFMRSNPNRSFTDAFERQALDHLTRFIQANRLSSAGSELVEQLPDWVWTCFSHGMRISMPPRMKTSTSTGTDGTPIRFAVYSRGVTGDQLESALQWHRGLLRDQPSLSTVITTSINIDFRLVRDSSELQLPWEWRESTPQIVVTVGPPLPPEGVVGHAFDAVVRGQLGWHLKLPGGDSRQEKRTAIWTWAVFLLMKEQMSFYDARWAVEERTRGNVPEQPRRRNWFEKSRAKLIDRVPEAEKHVYPRQRRTKSPRASGS